MPKLGETNKSNMKEYVRVVHAEWDESKKMWRVGHPHGIFEYITDESFRCGFAPRDGEWPVQESEQILASPASVAGNDRAPRPHYEGPALKPMPSDEPRMTGIGEKEDTDGGALDLPPRENATNDDGA